MYHSFHENDGLRYISSHFLSNSAKWRPAVFLSLKWSDRLTGVVSKKSDDSKMCLSSNRFNKAWRRDKAAERTARGSLWQTPLKDVKPLNILMEAQTLTTLHWCHLQPRCLVACCSLENNDTYPKEGPVHRISHPSQKEAVVQRCSKMTKVCFQGCYLFSPLHLWNGAASIISAAQI